MGVWGCEDARVVGNRVTGAGGGARWCVKGGEVEGEGVRNEGGGERMTP